MNTRKPKPSEDYSKFDPATGEQVLDSSGREMPDPEPMQLPIGYNRQPSLAQQIREQIMSHHLAEAARTAGMETFEEADDFAVGDDWEAEQHSPYEANFDPMTPEERAALDTRPGDRPDPERVLSAAEKAAISKARRNKKSGDQPDTVDEADRPNPQSEAEHSED